MDPLTLPRSLRPVALSALCLTSVALWTAAPARAERPAIPTVTHVIEPGDTCAGVARRYYGDGTRWDIVHEFNPRLGPTLPHRLVPGETLTLPPTLPPDAWVTEVVREVEHRPGTVEGWSPAEPGTALEVGYRVNTHARSAAELTFRDDSVLELHQNTLLVIHGRTASETQIRPNRVRLARGTLRSRLAGLRGEADGGVRVESDAAVASMRAGQAVMAVDGAGASAVSNHAGGAVAVASVGARGEVEVGAGMGTVVEKGRAPLPPRPLPDPPTWRDDVPARALGAQPADAVVRLAWAPAPGAKRYRVELEREGQRFAAADLPADPPVLRLTGLPAGRFAAQLMVMDADGLVSRPSAPRAFEIAGVAGGERLPAGTRIAGCAPAGSAAAEAIVAAGDNRLTCGDRAITVIGEQP